MAWICRQVLLSLTLLFFLQGVVFAEGERITKVVIKGNRKIETSVILNAVKLKTGDLLTMEGVDKDLRALYSLGYFQDVKAETEKSDAEVSLIYSVTEKPVIREIKFQGNKEIAADKIKEAFGLKEKSIFASTELNNGVKKVKKLYTDQGYYLAEISAVTEVLPDSGIKVTLKITEKDKILIKTIKFEGNKVLSARKLKGAMETGEKWFLSWITDAGMYKEEVLKNDVMLIADLYYNIGYVNVKVGEPKVELLPDKSALIVSIGITEGDQYRVGSIGFKGELLETKEFLAGKVKMKTGDVFSRAMLRGDIATLTDLYADKGYAFTNVNPLSSVDSEKKTISFNFEFEKGEKVYIDRINISGNAKTRDKVIRREMKLAEGDVFSATAMKKSKQALMNLGFFEQANLAIAKGSAANKQNINVEVKEKPTGTFSVGAGYSSLDGVVGQGSVSQSNFLGLGLKATLAASLGGKTQTYNIGVTDPYFMDSKWTLGADIYRTQRDYNDFSRRVTGGDIKAGYPLSDTLSTLWVYKYEDKQIYKESRALMAEIEHHLVQAPDATSTTSSITASLTRNTTDFRPSPSNGMINSLSTEFAGLGGTNHFLRYITNTTIFFPFKWGTVFSIRGELGYIHGTDTSAVPIDEKFYLGGINTIRGYSSRTVSPYLDTTFKQQFFTFVPYPHFGKKELFGRAFLGGDAEAFMNLEYVFPISKEAGLKGVLFFDAGQAYASIGDAFKNALASYGFGIRWISPMGPLRIEYGIPLNPRPNGVDSKTGRLEFSMGSSF